MAIIAWQKTGEEMQLWGLKTCDTTRKALKALRDSGREVDFTDVRESGISDEFAARLVALWGDKAVTRASATFRGLSAEERELAAETLLTRYPLTMKRPVIAEGDTWTQGWNAAAQAHWL